MKSHGLTFIRSVSLLLTPNYRSQVLELSFHGPLDVEHEVSLSDLVDGMLQLAHDDKDGTFRANCAATPGELRALAKRIEAAAAANWPAPSIEQQQ